MIKWRAMQRLVNDLCRWLPNLCFHPFYPNEDLEGCDVPRLKPIRFRFMVTLDKKEIFCMAKYQGSYIAVKEHHKERCKVVREYRVQKSNDSVPCVPKAHGIAYMNGVGVQL